MYAAHTHGSSLHDYFFLAVETLTSSSATKACTGLCKVRMRLSVFESTVSVSSNFKRYY